MPEQAASELELRSDRGERDGNGEVPPRLVRGSLADLGSKYGFGLERGTSGSFQENDC